MVKPLQICALASVAIAIVAIGTMSMDIQIVELGYQVADNVDALRNLRKV